MRLVEAVDPEHRPARRPQRRRPASGPRARSRRPLRHARRLRLDPARRSRATPLPPSPRRSSRPGRRPRAAGRARARARPGSRRPSRARRRRPARAASRSPRRLTLKAISGRRAPTITPPGALVEPRRAEVRCELARVDPPLQLLWPPRRKKAGPRPGASSPYRNTGSPSSSPIRRASTSAVSLRPFHVLRLDRHDRDDVGGADPRMGAFVPAQVDRSRAQRDPRKQRLDQRRPPRRRA